MTNGRTWIAEWPHSAHPAAPEAGTEIEFVEPDPDTVDLAFELASSYEKQGQAVFLHRADLELVCLCLKRVGDKTYSYERLKDGGIAREFSEYERRMLSRMLDQLTSPPDSEVRNFLKSAKPKLKSESEGPRAVTE